MRVGVAALRNNGRRSVITSVASSMSSRHASSCLGSSSRTNSLLLVQQQQPSLALAYQRAWFSSYPEHEVVGLPKLSPTMESGSISNWNLEEGDEFGAGDILCSVETDKATVDFEAQDEGVLAKILVPAGGDDIALGTPILITCEEKDDVAAFADYKVDAAAAAPSQPEPAAAPEPAPTPAAAPPPPPAPAAAPAATASSGQRAVASPLARMLAQEMGYNDLSLIPGTGPGGRILASDVKEYVPSAEGVAVEAVADVGGAPAPAQAAMAAAPIPGAGYTDYPLDAASQEAAARLAQSKRNVPHYYLTVDVTVDELLKLRSSLNAGANDENDKIGVYELLLKAAGAAMKAVPSANASWMDSVVRVYDSVDINVVLGAGDTLTTPVIRNVGTKGLKSIQQDLNNAMTYLNASEDADDAAAALPSAPVEYDSMGTFTVVNLGMYGIKSCAPIIREPQSCALALGALENRIVPNDDDSEDADIYKESVVLTATLSCDHRVVDGAVGAQWLSAFKSHVENPNTLLL